MKHLKLYENTIEDEYNSFKNKMLNTFKINTYWRFKNDIQDSICKVVNVHVVWQHNTLFVDFDIYLMTKENEPYEKFLDVTFTFKDMREFINDNKLGKIIFTKATEEEKEKFKVAKETDKYNI